MNAEVCLCIIVIIISIGKMSISEFPSIAVERLSLSLLLGDHSCQRGEARAWGALSHALRGAECLPRAPHWQVLNLPVLSCGTQL